MVHGGIRHLEKLKKQLLSFPTVHGGIRHLEKLCEIGSRFLKVHGGIRHLEIYLPRKFVNLSLIHI